MLIFNELPVKALGGFLLPTHLGFVGLWIFCDNDLLTVRDFCPTGWLKSSISQRLGTPPDSLKATNRTFHKPRNHGVSHCWCLWRTIFRQSAQLAQWAPSLILALVSPKPPSKNGTETVTSADPLRDNSESV